MTACCVGSAARIWSFVLGLRLCGACWLSATRDGVDTELLEGCGELLLPAVIELEGAIGGLGSKKDGLGSRWVDIVVEQALLVCPERNTVYDFTLHA